MVGDREETGPGARQLLLSFSQITAEGGVLNSELWLETSYVGPSAGTGTEVQEVVERHARERGRVAASSYARKMASWFRQAAKAQEEALTQKEFGWDDLAEGDAVAGPGSPTSDRSTTIPSP